MVSLIFVALLLAGCTQTQPPTPATTVPTAALPVTTAASAVPTTTSAVQGNGTLTIATTTSLYDTGLLNAVQDYYQKTYGVTLKITSQGTGKAIELAKRGDADLLLVHSPSQEKAFMDDGSGLNQRCFAYNYFMIIGPATDPAGIKGLAPEAAFAKIRTLGMKNTTGVAFISRGDNSGTHSAEKSIWGLAKLNYTNEIQKSGPWYIEAGKGMGETLIMADEKNAYTLTDEGTFLAFKKDVALAPLIDNGTALLNRYSAIAVNPDKAKNVNIAEANRFINWITSGEGKQFVGSFGKEKYGKALFTPLGADQCGKPPFNCDCSGLANATTSLPAAKAP